MNEANDHPLDAILRNHLDRAAGTVDGATMLRQIRESEKAIPRRSWLKWAGVGVGTAVAASVGGFVFFGNTPTSLAAAEQIVSEAKIAHALPTDRCYEVSTDWEPLLFRRLQLPAISRKHKLWTRGDQFWIETNGDGAKWAMGQETGGKIWFAISRKRGLVYEPSEAGEPLARFCDLVSLRVVSTLSELLEQFTLYRKDTGQPGEAIRIEADLKPSFLNRNPRFRTVKLELDPITKIVQRAEFQRQLNGEPVGTLRFTLLETANQPDEMYTLLGHLDADHEVFDRKDPARQDRRTKFRDEFLKRVQQRIK